MKKGLFALLLVVVSCGYATISNLSDNSDRSDTSLHAHDIYVVDGDTIKLGAQSYRLMGFDTPETYRHRCASEKKLGDKATHHLKSLIAQAGDINLQDTGRFDKYQRGLARLLVDGRDVGDILIQQGLARPYEGGKRRGWC